MGKIREALKSVFPMPARSADSRIRALEDSLRNISAAQEELAARLEKLQDSAEETKAIQKNTQEYAAEGAHAVDIWDRVQYPELMTALGGLAEQIGCVRTELSGLTDQIGCERAELAGADSRVQEAVREAAACREALDALEREVREIKDGDIFRRIEFTQGKLMHLEELLQKNLLGSREQWETEEYRFICRMRSLFPLAGVSQGSFVRVGRPHDGGYVMYDDFAGRRIAYSIGIADDVSWDRDMAERGLEVYMYDHTISGLPETNEAFHFFQTGLGTGEEAEGEKLMTLPQMLRSNGHENERGMILKIDIEGAEWNVLRELDREVLEQFSQIVFEFHGLTDPRNEEKIAAAMERLNESHQLVHLHANNYGSYLLLGGVVLPELLEGTYLLKSEYDFCEKPVYAADQANNRFIPDIFLGSWGTGN